MLLRNNNIIVPKAPQRTCALVANLLKFAREQTQKPSRTLWLMSVNGRVRQAGLTKSSGLVTPYSRTPDGNMGASGTRVA
jgi:hypothetical protein